MKRIVHIAPLVQLLARESETDKKVKAKQEAIRERNRSARENETPEQKAKREAKIEKCRLENPSPPLSVLIARVEEEKKIQEAARPLINYPLESKTLRVLIINCLKFMPIGVRMNLYSIERGDHRAKIATIRKDRRKVYMFRLRGTQGPRFLSREEIKEAISHLLPHVGFIELFGPHNLYIKLYLGEKDAQEAKYATVPGESVAEISVEGHVISRVALNKKGLWDGVEERLVLFDGIPLLRRYWRRGTRVSKKQYNKSMGKALDGIGILPVLHSIITGF